MRSILVALPLLLLATPAVAQQTDEQLWLQTNASVAIGAREKVSARPLVAKTTFTWFGLRKSAAVRNGVASVAIGTGPTISFASVAICAALTRGSSAWTLITKSAPTFSFASAMRSVPL
jgi:hypothetical protein